MLSSHRQAFHAAKQSGVPFVPLREDELIKSLEKRSLKEVVKQRQNGTEDMCVELVVCAHLLSLTHVHL